MRREITSLFKYILILFVVIIVMKYFEAPPLLTLGSSLIIILGFVREQLLKVVFDKMLNLFNNNSWESSFRALKKSNKINDDTMIRISFAYLFRIKINGKYFLIKSGRTGLYHPVGGAYKLSNSESEFLTKTFSVLTDDYIPLNEATRNDYRLNVKAKYLKRFVKRFDKKGVDREKIDDISREFIEEIFVSNILNKEIFEYLDYTYIGRHFTKVEKTISGRYELLLADIVHVNLTDNQKGMFIKLMSKNDDRYAFATNKEIDVRGTIPGTNNLRETIANHTYKILVENSDQLKKIRKYNGKYRVFIN